MVDQEEETYRNERSEDQVKSQEIQSERGSIAEQNVCPRLDQITGFKKSLKASAT